MKILYSFKKLIRFTLVMLMSGVIFSCQEDILNTGDDFLQSDPPGFKSAPATWNNATASDYMIISKSETLSTGLLKKLREYGEIINTVPEIGTVVISPVVPDFEDKIARMPEVLAVVPDIMVRWVEPGGFNEANPPSIGSDETNFPYQWGMDAINAPEAWNAGYTGESATVFILDAGIDADHPDLAPNLIRELSTSFVPDEVYDVATDLEFSHGSHVAGIIAAADNSLGVIGVAPNAKIVAVKVISEETGSGSFDWINAGIIYAANNGADVINMSLGATFNRNGFYIDDYGYLQKVPAVYLQQLILTQQRAVNYASSKGVVIVSSAGNGGTNFDGNASIYKIPAELQNVIAVSATAPDSWYNSLLNGIDPFLDIPSSYTDYGRSLVDIAAPGGDFDFYPQPNYYWDYILSTNNAGYAWMAGTSMASPHVAGVAALIIGKNGGQMAPHLVIKQLLKTADKIDGNGVSVYYGNGRVNAFRAVTE